MHLDHDDGHTHADGTMHTHGHFHSPGGEPGNSSVGGLSIHSGENYNCSECGYEHAEPKEELTALLRYMVEHNASHAKELSDLAAKLKDLGEGDACDRILQAVRDFEKGNLLLTEVLAAMKE